MPAGARFPAALEEIEILAGGPRFGGHVVGVDLLGVPVRHPHGIAVGPDAVGRGVAGVFQGIEVAAGDPRLRLHVVGEELPLDIGRDPHRLAVGPDGQRHSDSGVCQGIEILAGDPRLGVHIVGEELRGPHTDVRHPHGVAIGPEASRALVGSAGQGVEVRHRVPGDDAGRGRGRGRCRPVRRREYGETMPPGVVGVRATPLLRVVLQVVGDLDRGEFREPLAHQRGHAGHVGRRLAGAAEAPVVVVQGASGRYPAVCPDDVGLDPPVRGWAAAAESLDGVDVVPGGRAHGQHAGVGAFRRIADAAVPGVVLNGRRIPYRYLNPGRRVATLVADN